MPDVGIVVAVLVVANVVVFVFPLLGTTMVEAMPDSAMVARALYAWINVMGPCDEGEEPVVGVFSSSGTATVVAEGLERKWRGLQRLLGPPFFEQIFLSGWRQCLGEQQLAVDSTRPGPWLFWLWSCGLGTNS